MLKLIGLVCLASVAALPASAQSFSCRGGAQPACIDYGAKICSSFSKCVDQNAVVFDSYTCNYKGFVCKSTLDDVAEKHDVIVQKFNTLLDEHQQTISRYNALLRDSQSIAACIQDAATIDQAKQCSP